VPLRQPAGDAELIAREPSRTVRKAGYPERFIAHRNYNFLPALITDISHFTPS
jgi:hypothetical protein